MEARADLYEREPVLPEEYVFERDQPDTVCGAASGGATVYLGSPGERDVIFRFEAGWRAEDVEEAVFAYDHDLIDFAEGFFALCERAGYTPDGFTPSG